MNQQTVQHLDAIRNALLSLEPAGDTGFEGLLAATLAIVCNQPFRLASSGSQRGRDGDSAFDDGATYFEAKRYRDEVPKGEIGAKLINLAADDKGQVDTWVLGVTSEVSAQNAELFKDAAAGYGLGLVLLDWSESSLPALVALLGMAAQTTKDFLRAHVPIGGAAAIAQATSDAIDHIVGLPEFSGFADTLRKNLITPNVSLGLAKDANSRWLKQTFSNRITARARFGQPLAPKDPQGLALFPRTDLKDLLKKAFTGVPKNAVVAVIGDEGAGKSWLVADGWLSAHPASLLVIANAKDLQDPADLHGMEDFLIRLLIRQTDDAQTEAAKLRWRRRLKGWLANPAPVNARLTVCIDGLEQASAYPSARWIDAATLFLYERGCCLVVTTRSTHFAQLRNALTSTVERVPVLDWSEGELTAILNKRDIDGNTLSADVFRTLRNPRILGIAVELLDAQSIQSLQELTVGRLLFEHVRQCEKTGASTLTGPEFAKTLQNLAKEVVDRMKNEQVDDLRLVDANLNERIRAVSSSRFFRAIGEDPDLYEIENEGLQLALGLWLVSVLDGDLRNNRDPAERLGIVLDPISALDMATEVVACATEIVCLRDPCPLPVASALIRSFVSLQNASMIKPEALRPLARRAPDAFLQALEDAALAGQHVNNIDWLVLALRDSRDDPRVWQAISARVPAWLSTYSLSPDRKTDSMTSQGMEKTAEARSKAAAKIDAAVLALTDGERKYLDAHMVQSDERDPDDLHRFAFTLLAGKPLAGFAIAFVAWALAQALNSSNYAPRDEFQQLIRMNPIDWNVTREALHVQLAQFGEEPHSRIGQWMVVAVLRATGDLSDAKVCDTLVAELTKDRERFSPWRLVGTYCETDPCDPTALQPENVTKTAQQFESLAPPGLRTGLGFTREDHFFQDALPGVARFAPQSAIAAIRRFAKDALNREEPARRFAIYALLPHSAILDDASADALIALAQSVDADAPGEPSESWVTAQYALLLALLHRDGNKQLEAIRAMRGHNLLIRLLEELTPADEQTVEASLRQAVDAQDEDMQIRVLSVINYTRAPLSALAKGLVSDLLRSPTRRVRTQVLGVIAGCDDSALVQQVIDSQWIGGSLNPDSDQYEIYYGSTVLLKAAQKGAITTTEAINRISLAHYGRAALALGTEAAIEIAEHVSSALYRALDFRNFPSLPDIERQVSRSDDQAPVLVRLADNEASSETELTPQANADADNEFAIRQERAQRAFRQFSKDLTTAEARLILTDLGFEGVAAVASARPDLANAWVTRLLNSDAPTLSSLQLFAVQLLRAIASNQPQNALQLWQAVAAVEPLMRHVTGRARIPVDKLALWESASEPCFRAECFKSFDEAASDHAIAQEVLAASLAKRSDVIVEYVETLLSFNEPASIARALMVCGFSEENPHAAAILHRYEDAAGFIGTAANAARFAYDRNRWSRHWYSEAAAAVDPIKFWRNSVLLEKIVDARIELWQSKFATSNLFRTFFATIEDRLDSRIQKWDSARRNQLYGDKVPKPGLLARRMVAG